MNSLAIVLTREQWQTILNVLGEVPTKIGMPLVVEIQRQANSPPAGSQPGMAMENDAMLDSIHAYHGAQEDHLHPHKHTAVPLPNGGYGASS